MNVRVAGYGRVSTQGQIDGTSPEEQKSLIENACTEKGYELVDFYSDDAFSGADDNRPGLQRLLSDARAGKFDMMMFTKLDRLGRNLRDVKNIIHHVTNIGLKYFCVQQPEINNDGVYADLLFNMLASFAEFEVRMIKERTNSGRIRRWKEGKGAIGSLPLGYTRKNGKIEIYEKKAKIYRKIVSMYLYEKFSMRDIAIKLTAEGIPSPSGRSKKWHNVTVTDILKNTVYKGEAIQNRFEFKRRVSVAGNQYYCSSKVAKPEGEWIIIKYPPLIKEEEHNQILARIENQKRKPKKHHMGHEDHFMAENVLFCGYCGARIKKVVTPAARYLYCCFWWHASRKERQSNQREKCLLGTIEADAIDYRIFAEIAEALSNPGDFAKEWLKDMNVQELKERVAVLSQRDKELEARLSEGFEYIKNKNSNLARIYRSSLAKDEEEFMTNRSNLKRAADELKFVENKVDRLAEFDRALASSSKFISASAWFKTKGDLMNFILKLPSEEKKRLTEAIISPETGGKVLVRYRTEYDDFRDGKEYGPPITAEELTRPRPDYEPFLEMNFNMDLNRVEAVIRGLNRNELLGSVGSR